MAEYSRPVLNACGETCETLARYTETIDLDGIPVRTANLEGLLRTKQTMRLPPVHDLRDYFVAVLDIPLMAYE